MRSMLRLLAMVVCLAAQPMASGSSVGATHCEIRIAGSCLAISTATSRLKQDDEDGVTPSDDEGDMDDYCELSLNLL